jgi:catechol 2,3-dioxygenase
MTQLGHIVLYVKDLDSSVHFYREIVGLQLQGRTFNDRAAVLTGGNTHHELMLIQVGPAPGPLQGKRIGLYHIGWQIGDNIETLKQKYVELQSLDYPIVGLADHTISQSIYLNDPDGNEIELFVDNPDYDWRHNHDWMEAPVKPLSLI